MIDVVRAGGRLPTTLDRALKASARHGLPRLRLVAGAGEGGGASQLIDTRTRWPWHLGQRTDTLPRNPMAGPPAKRQRLPHRHAETPKNDACNTRVAGSSASGS